MHIVGVLTFGTLVSRVCVLGHVISEFSSINYVSIAYELSSVCPHDVCANVKNTIDEFILTVTTVRF